MFLLAFSILFDWRYIYLSTLSVPVKIFEYVKGITECEEFSEFNTEYTLQTRKNSELGRFRWKLERK